jgi:hypothetical protein
MNVHCVVLFQIHVFVRIKISETKQVTGVQHCSIVPLHGPKSCKLFLLLMAVAIERYGKCNKISSRKVQNYLNSN